MSLSIRFVILWLKKQRNLQSSLVQLPGSEMVLMSTTVGVVVPAERACSTRSPSTGERVRKGWRVMVRLWRTHSGQPGSSMESLYLHAMRERHHHRGHIYKTQWRTPVSRQCAYKRLHADVKTANTLHCIHQSEIHLAPLSDAIPVTPAYFFSYSIAPPAFGFEKCTLERDPNFGVIIKSHVNI